MALQFLYWMFVLIVGTVSADPETNLLNLGCSQYNASNPKSFYSNRNATFSDLRRQMTSNSSITFATARTVRSSDPVYALFQCRPYLSAADCLACLATASNKLLSCGAGNGGRVIYDGCFLRYESAGFFDQTSLPGNMGICGSKKENGATSEVVGEVVEELGQVTAKVKGYFAAVAREGVWAVAQCAETVSEQGCGDCLKVAVNNVRGCLEDTEGRAVDAGCFLRFGDKEFFGGNWTTNLQQYLDSVASSKKKAIIGGAVGGVGGLLLLGFMLLLWIRRPRKSQNTRKGDLLGATELRGPVNFRYGDLKSATQNFSEKNKLGGGGFGDVYKGVLGNGKIVAVKRLTVSQASRAKADFESEVKLISNVHHRNLIRLLGCSSKGVEMLLVYEFMANNSLDKFLFGDKRGSLSWKQRFDIIVGMARGLSYLHHEFHVCIIHRDIKSSNVLLDDDFQPRIADFGLAKLLPGDQSHLSTGFAGTLGYTAPEYALHGKLSEKVDLYSYGVVVLEMISGRKSNDITLEPISQYLLEWAWNLYENGTVLEMVDKTLDPNGYDPEEMKRIIEIALLCTQSSVAARPTMSEVVILLLSKGTTILPPTRPTFIDAGSKVRGHTSTSSGTETLSASQATISITQFSAR